MVDGPATNLVKHEARLRLVRRIGCNRRPHLLIVRRIERRAPAQHAAEVLEGKWFASYGSILAVRFLVVVERIEPTRRYRRDRTQLLLVVACKWCAMRVAHTYVSGPQVVVVVVVVVEAPPPPCPSSRCRPAFLNCRCRERRTSSAGRPCLVHRLFARSQTGTRSTPPPADVETRRHGKDPGPVRSTAAPSSVSLRSNGARRSTAR